RGGSSQSDPGGTGAFLCRGIACLRGTGEQPGSGDADGNRRVAEAGGTVMTDAIISAAGLLRHFGDTRAEDGVDLHPASGSVLGLIGPNGAGKTTLLRALLGLTRCEGQLSVLGLDPRQQHAELMQRACFIADTAVLPRWMSVGQLLDY